MGPLRAHRGYSLRSGRRILGWIRPSETRDTYLWRSNLTEAHGAVRGLERAIDRVLDEARVSPRTHEIDLVDEVTGRRRPLLLG